MIKFIKDYFEKQRIRRDLLVLLAEAKANLEFYYVMFQLGKLRFFELSAWEKTGRCLGIVWENAVTTYTNRLAEYNRVLKEYKDFELWYNENLDRKNQDNGRILHKKKELAQAQFEGLEIVIKAAVAVFDQQAAFNKTRK